MTRELLVHLLPAWAEPQALQGGTAVVIDVLRASTTIVHALAAGALEVHPCETVEAARDTAEELPGEVVLGGERGGKLIDGFDLGNSPLDYSPEAVCGRPVVFTTTNGTRTLARCRSAERVLIGGFVNLSAVVDVLLQDQRPVHLVCAGTDGAVSSEDVLCAGAIAAELLIATAESDPPDDAARIALDCYRMHAVRDADLKLAIANSRGGRNLRRLGCESDIDVSAKWDLFAIVPETAGGVIRPLRVVGIRNSA